MEAVDKKIVKFGIVKIQNTYIWWGKNDKLKSLENQRLEKSYLKHLNDGEMKLKSYISLKPPEKNSPKV